jgi:hypothetical protein
MPTPALARPRGDVRGVAVASRGVGGLRQGARGWDVRGLLLRATLRGRAGASRRGPREPGHPAGRDGWTRRLPRRLLLPCTASGRPSAEAGTTLDGGAPRERPRGVDVPGRSLLHAPRAGVPDPAAGPAPGNDAGLSEYAPPSDLRPSPRRRPLRSGCARRPPIVAEAVGTNRRRG